MENVEHNMLNDRLISRTDAAELLGLSVDTIIRREGNGLTKRTVGRSVRYLQSEVMALVKEAEDGSA